MPSPMERCPWASYGALWPKMYSCAGGETSPGRNARPAQPVVARLVSHVGGQGVGPPPLRRVGPGRQHAAIWAATAAPASHLPNLRSGSRPSHDSRRESLLSNQFESHRGIRGSSYRSAAKVLRGWRAPPLRQRFLGGRPSPGGDEGIVGRLAGGGTESGHPTERCTGSSGTAPRRAGAGHGPLDRRGELGPVLTKCSSRRGPLTGPSCRTARADSNRRSGCRGDQEHALSDDGRLVADLHNSRQNVRCADRAAARPYPTAGSRDGSGCTAAHSGLPGGIPQL